MTKNEYYKLRGYIDILETLPPNGRYVHNLRNKLTGLKMLLFQQMAIPAAYEKEVRLLINKSLDNSENCATTVQNINTDSG